MQCYAIQHATFMNVYAVCNYVMNVFFSAIIKCFLSPPFGINKTKKLSTMT